MDCQAHQQACCNSGLSHFYKRGCTYTSYCQDSIAHVWCSLAQRRDDKYESGCEWKHHVQPHPTRGHLEGLRNSQWYIRLPFSLIQGMEDVFNAGLAKAIGISNYNLSQVKRILAVATVKPANLQACSHNGKFSSSSGIQLQNGFYRLNVIHIFSRKNCTTSAPRTTW